MAILIYQALIERRRNGRAVPLPAVLAFGATVLLGFLDEGIQGLLSNRVFGWIDVGFNTIAALIAIMGSMGLAWARRLHIPTR